METESPRQPDQVWSLAQITLLSREAVAWEDSHLCQASFPPRPHCLPLPSGLQQTRPRRVCPRTARSRVQLLQGPAHTGEMQHHSACMLLWQQCILLKQADRGMPPSSMHNFGILCMYGNVSYEEVRERALPSRQQGDWSRDHPRPSGPRRWQQQRLRRILGRGQQRYSSCES